MKELLVTKLDRRSFITQATAAGGAFLFGVAAPDRRVPLRAGVAAHEVTCWVLIAPDNSVTIRTARSEMGQGALTGLAMLVAEELECDWSSVRTEFVQPGENVRRNRAWGDLSTSASRSIAFSQQSLREAGAAAREMLISAAADRWDVAPSDCRAENGIITHLPTGRRLPFGTVAAQAAKMEPPSHVRLKQPSEWKLIGTRRGRLDLPDKVTGKTIYAIDVRLPKMLYAAIVHCPVFGGRLKGVDESSIANMPGVRRLVRMPSAVAVVGDSWWQAQRAAGSLKITWDSRANARVSSESIAAMVQARLDTRDAQVGHLTGDVAAGLANATRRIEAQYSVPFLAHATMEPQTCTAHVRPDGVEIWAPTQDAMTALANAGAAAGVPHEQVTVHRTMVGGAFGRRAAIQDFVREAVLIAKEAGQPVKLIWTREQDIQHDVYRPAGMARLVGGLGQDGLPLAMSIRLAGPSMVPAIVSLRSKTLVDKSFVSGLADEMLYAIPNYLVDCAICDTPVPIGPLRGINYTANAFYRESFIDEMAQAAGFDPYQYRRHLLRNQPRAVAVLDAAAEKANWGTSADGIFRGIAVDQCCGSISAQVVELSIENGRVRVHRVCAAIDCGHVVNPLSVEAQLEGGIIFALSAALYGEISIRNGAAMQSNFHDYRMVRMAGAPKVETVIVSGGDSWGGVGEPSVPPLAPALCNAIFAATGKRIRSLPLQKHELLNG